MIQYLDKNKLDSFAQDVLNKTFPGYNGRKFKLSIQSKVRLSDTNWSGGTKSEYALFNTDTMQSVSIPQAPFMQRSNLHESDIEIPANFIIVEHSIFCGQDTGITFIVSPLANNNLLKGNNTELTRNEKIVLFATRSLKSSYNGISNYRYYEAHNETGITINEWNQTKQELINKGLLNSIGAITNDGKNAITDLYSFYDFKRQS